MSLLLFIVCTPIILSHFIFSLYQCYLLWICHLLFIHCYLFALCSQSWLYFLFPPFRRPSGILIHDNSMLLLKQKLNNNNIATKENHTNGYTHKRSKWNRFTYFLHETQISKIFRDTDTRVAFRTTNTLQKHLQPKQQRSNKFNNSDIYTN
jgi:hypothetical protein